MILAEVPVYKFRLGRPSRLPSVFINFETDPRLCPHPQKHYFLIPTSPNLWHPTPLGHPFGRPLGHPLRHPCLSSTIQPSTLIHLLSPVLPTPLTGTSLGPHSSGSASDVCRMSALRVTCGSEPLVTNHWLGWWWWCRWHTLGHTWIGVWDWIRFCCFLLILDNSTCFFDLVHSDHRGIYEIVQ